MSEVNLLLGKSGFALFTFGLIIGAAIPRFRNPRMGLSAHTTAVQCGTALIAFAVFWPHLSVAAWAADGLSISLIASSVLLIAGLCLAAVCGASKALPLAGQGYSASAAAERAVAFLTIGSSVWMLLACLAICWFPFFA